MIEDTISICWLREC